MFSFNIILTEICNAKCSHCYMASSNSRKTLSKENVKIIIDKMPNNTKSVVLTGGEIFLVWDLLLYSITQLRVKFPKIIIGLESNGIILYKGIETAKEKLNCLKKCGADFIRFSDDPFHESGGVDLESVRKLKELESETEIQIKYLVQSKALAIGNGATLSEEYIEKKNCMNTPSTIENPYLFLDVEGNVYICTWKCVPPIGNMLNDSLEEIINNLKYDFSRLVLSGQIEKAINSLEKEETKKTENIDYSKVNGQCMLCHKHFSSWGGKDMSKYSFMIPVYNKAEYLKKYFSRIQNQTFNDYEIVVIDDCSKSDNSYQYLLDLASSDERIKLFRNNQNLGLGLTRNELLKRASGEYVIFIDPDDYIEEELLEKIDEALQENQDLDIVRFQNVSEPMTKKQVEIESRKNPYRFSCEPTEVIIGEEALLGWMLGINKINTMPWTYCIKRILYSNVEYPETNILEDFAITHYLIAKAKKVKAISFVGYHYLQYDDSLTKNYSSLEEEIEFDRKKQILFGYIIDLTKKYILTTDISLEAKVIFFKDIDNRFIHREERLAEKEKTLLGKKR